MMCFNLFSHGTQDLYPTFLQKQHNFDPGDGELDRHRRQSRRDRRRPLLRPRVGEDRPRQRDHHRGAHRAAGAAAYGPTPRRPSCSRSAPSSCRSRCRAPGASFPPISTNCRPGAARATIPAFVYQAGNFLASYNGPFQAQIAEANGGNYGFALALVAGVVAVAIIVVIRFSPERRGELLKAH